MIKYSRAKILMMLTAVVMMLNGCTSYNAVKVSQPSINNSKYFLTNPPLYAGDKIRYQLRDGKKGDMTVARLTPQTIVGQNGVNLPASDLNSLEKEEISGVKTGTAVGGGVVAVGVIFSAFLASALVAGIVAG